MRRFKINRHCGDEIRDVSAVGENQTAHEHRYRTVLQKMVILTFRVILDFFNQNYYHWRQFDTGAAAAVLLRVLVANSKRY